MSERMVDDPSQHGWVDVGNGKWEWAAGGSGDFDNSHTFGADNVSVGTNSISDGNLSVGVGVSALEKSNSSAVWNTAVGYCAAQNSTTGSSNTAIGNVALQSNTTGNYLTAIGNAARASVDGLSNSTAIGSNAVVDASNKIQLGDTEVTLVHTHGSMQATDFLDAEGNSIMGGGGGGSSLWTEESDGSISRDSVVRVNSGITGTYTEFKNGQGIEQRAPSGAENGSAYRILMDGMPTLQISNGGDYSAPNAEVSVNTVKAKNTIEADDFDIRLPDTFPPSWGNWKITIDDTEGDLTVLNGRGCGFSVNRAGRLTAVDAYYNVGSAVEADDVIGTHFMYRNGNRLMQTLTQAEYDALTPNADTVYFIV